MKTRIFLTSEFDAVDWVHWFCLMVNTMNLFVQILIEPIVNELFERRRAIKRASSVFWVITTIYVSTRTATDVHWLKSLNSFFSSLSCRFLFHGQPFFDKQIDSLLKHFSLHDELYLWSLVGLVRQGDNWLIIVFSFRKKKLNDQIFKSANQLEGSHKIKSDRLTCVSIYLSHN